MDRCEKVMEIIRVSDRVMKIIRVSDRVMKIIRVSDSDGNNKGE